MKRCLLKTGIMMAAAALLFSGTILYRQYKITEEIAGKIIRFHVRANSDTKIDQELKLKVRDAIGNYMQPKLSGISDIEKSRQIVKENLEQIEKAASSVIAAEGYTYPVTASLTITKFPEKTYGAYTFPAGNYEALEVLIGKGKGHNWWCVMYPNMCFFNSTYEVVDEEADKSLQQALTQAEYEALMEHKNFKVKFALVEQLREIFENL